MFKVRGYDSSLGLAALSFKPATENSVLVDLLLNSGAVLYCKTNVPQALMALDSHNNVFGRTLNPINTALTAGGSTGGEGALLAMRGSILGVGTDVGRSSQVPSVPKQLTRPQVDLSVCPQCVTTSTASSLVTVVSRMLLSKAVRFLALLRLVFRPVLVH